MLSRRFLVYSRLLVVKLGENQSYMWIFYCWGSAPRTPALIKGQLHFQAFYVLTLEIRVTQTANKPSIVFSDLTLRITLRSYWEAGVRWKDLSGISFSTPACLKASQALSLSFIISSLAFFEVLIIEWCQYKSASKGINHVHGRSFRPLLLSLVSLVSRLLHLVFPLLSLFFFTLSYFLKLSLCLTSSSLALPLFLLFKAFVPKVLLF